VDLSVGRNGKTHVPVSIDGSPPAEGRGRRSTLKSALAVLETISDESVSDGGLLLVAEAIKEPVVGDSEGGRELGDVEEVCRVPSSVSISEWDRGIIAHGNLRRGGKEKESAHELN
jgi:hypothetical protein